MSDTSSIRIIDMPDLGAVDDTSSVVGEKAGSGRFQASAMRSYVLSALSGGDLTADSYSSTSGLFYAGTSPSSTNYLRYDTASGNWSVAHNGVANFTVNADGSASLLGALSAAHKINISGPTINSIGMYSTTIGSGGGFWYNTANQIWFGLTDSTGSGVDGFGYLTNNGMMFETASVTLAVTGGSFCSGDNANFYVPNHAWKPGGGSWSDSSDARIKEVMGNYTAGLDAVLALRPVHYKYLHNWQRADGSRPVAHNRTYVGLVAQEAEKAMPEMVSQTDAVINGERVNDMRVLDMTALPLALVNAIRELTARVVALETQLRAAREA